MIKPLRWLMPMGMIAVLSFLAFTIFGKLLWPEYSYIRSYISVLMTDEAPHVHLMRVFINIYTICFFLFAFAESVYAFRTTRLCLKIGYSILFIVAFISLLGYGTVPISMVFIFSPNDILHMIVTITVLCLTAAALFLIAAGYLRQKRLRTMGKITLVSGILFTLLNVLHIWAIVSGKNILGLIEWLTFYSFHAFTFSISWICTFKYKDMHIKKRPV